MTLRYRRSRSFGPLRLTATRRGVRPSLGFGRLRVGTRGVSVRLARGLSWWRGWSR